MTSLRARRAKATRWLLAVAALLVLGAALLLLPSARSIQPSERERGAPLTGRFGGVNLAGGEFAPKRLPGRYGHDYSYPDAAAATPFLRAGFDAVRVPVRWERLQPAPMAPLDAREMARLDRSFDALGRFRVIILDVHNYARYAGQRLDVAPGSGAMLADFWTRLARHYRDRPQIAFGMMNEPFKISAADWRAVADQTIVAIRETGARNLVLIPGTRWTGAHSWNRLGPLSNASAMQGFKDPGNNFAFELHQYLDEDSSGTGTSCVDPAKAAQRLAGVTRWLRQERARGVLAEFGVADDPQCLAGLEALLQTMARNDDVWLGWTYWAAGRRWGKYAFNIQPGAAGPDARMQLLARYLPR